MSIRQLIDKESSTLTYILSNNGEAIIIDPVKEQVERDIRVLKEMGVELKYVIDTHIHADHITGSTPISLLTGAKIVLSDGSRDAGAICADIYVKEGEKLVFGETEVKILETPGHTTTCITIELKEENQDFLFTGDVLMHRNTGRTDFQLGSPEQSYDSVNRLYKYDGSTIVYSGHDYEGLLSTTVGESRKYNNSLNSEKGKEQFISEQIEQNKHKQPPVKNDIAIPGCLKCGKE